jgi:hypothetical protein
LLVCFFLRDGGVGVVLAFEPSEFESNKTETETDKATRGATDSTATAQINLNEIPAEI